MLTNGPYSHVELVFSDGRCFSASGHDGVARWKVQDLSTAWDFVSIPGVTVEQETTAAAFVDPLHGTRFDYMAIYSFVLPFLPDDPARWYCSELCLVVLQQCCGLLKCLDKKIHPNRLFKITSTLWCE